MGSDEYKQSTAETRKSTARQGRWEIIPPYHGAPRFALVSSHSHSLVGTLVTSGRETFRQACAVRNEDSLYEIGYVEKAGLTFITDVVWACHKLLSQKCA